jgi:hypothetical protein
MQEIQEQEHNGRTVRLGDLFRDRRESNVRTLRVDNLSEPGVAGLTVVRQEYNGEVSEPMRATAMTVARLLGRSFVPVDQEAGR